jgi:GH43 family beta-xylosidase
MFTALLALVLSTTSPVHAAAPATRPTFTNPVVRSVDAPDPWVIRKDGFYYFTATLEPDGGIWVWRSRTLTGLDAGEKVKVWAAPKTGPMSRRIWAPELHFLDGRWYVYFTASDGQEKNHRHFVLRAETDDPLGAYEALGRVDDLEAFAIDASVLRMPDGRLYWMVSTGKLEIGPMTDPASADMSRRVVLAEATHPWERGWLEAPQALVRDGRVFVVYSAGHSATPHYVLGLLEYTGGDVLDPKNWRKHHAPVFTPYVGADGSVFTTGHNCFTTSPDGTEDWLVYHGKDWRADDAGHGFRGRKTRVQPFTWNPDGTPNFGRPIPSSVPIPVPSGEQGLAGARGGR